MATETVDTGRVVDRPVKVISLTVKNVMQVKAVEIRPGKGPVKISGKNRAGKTTLMESAAMAMEGKDARPVETLRRGTTKGSIELELAGEDREIKAALTLRKGKADKLTVIGEKGTPAAILKKLRSGHTLDVRRFAQSSGAERIATIEKLACLDFADHDVERAGVYEKRKDANKETKRLTGALESTLRHEGLPDAVVSVAKLSGELQAGMEKNAGHARRRAALDDARADARAQNTRVTDCEGRVLAAETALNEARERLVAAETDLETMKTAGKAMADEVAALVDVELDSVRKQIANAEETNAKVRDNVAHAKLAAELEVAETKAGKLTDHLTAMDEIKADALAKAKYPIEGLTIGEDDVMLNGFSFGDNASGSEQLIASAAVDLALHPNYRVVYIDEAGDLDDETLDAFYAWAEANDVQPWLAFAGEEPGTIIIEDGTVKSEGAAPDGD